MLVRVVRAQGRGEDDGPHARVPRRPLGADKASLEPPGDEEGSHHVLPRGQTPSELGLPFSCGIRTSLPREEAFFCETGKILRTLAPEQGRGVAIAHRLSIPTIPHGGKRCTALSFLLGVLVLMRGVPRRTSSTSTRSFVCTASAVVCGRAGRVTGPAEARGEGAVQGSAKTHREEPLARACGRLGVHDIPGGVVSRPVGDVWGGLVAAAPRLAPMQHIFGRNTHKCSS